MNDNLLECIRKTHSEIEFDKLSTIHDLVKPETKQKKIICQRHRIKLRQQRISENLKRLLKFYENTDGVLIAAKKEVVHKNSLGVFYSRMNNILINRKVIIENPKSEEVPPVHFNISEIFSGEEFYGKYVEMNDLHQIFLNIKGMPSMYLNGLKKIDYKLYLEIFDHFHNIPQAAKAFSRPYRDYCENALYYLVSFYSRRNPLHPVDEIISEIKAEFEEKWASKSVPGWQTKWPAEAFQRQPIKSSLPLEERKQFLYKAADGQTRLCEICCRDFKESVWKGHIEETKQTAYFEFAIKILKGLLSEAFEETCYYIEKKLTRSFAEIQKELELREIEEDAEEEEFHGETGNIQDQSLWSGGVYNPKKVPLGWDGRPIPFWLYKFHGLNIGYKCEICGGTKYYGPRAFQQHFKEWKHANGMKALGLPNTKHFDNVTKIADAEALYLKLKEKKLIEMFNPDLEEEFEDGEGNVYGKQTYDALKRQRVI